jgi:hypothetical protein
MAKCPFSWTSQEKGCIFKRAVWEPVECLGEACKLWQEGDCVFNIIEKKLREIKSSKNP